MRWRGRHLRVGATLLIAIAGCAWILARGHARDPELEGASQAAGTSPRAPESPDSHLPLAAQGSGGVSPSTAEPDGATGAPAPSSPTRPKLTVRVLGPEGQPLPFIEITYWRGEARAGDRMLDGEFDARSLVGDVEDLEGWNFEVTYASLENERLGPARAGPLRPGTTTLEMRLPRGTVIDGVAVGPGGERVAGALIEARPAPPHGDARPDWHAPNHGMGISSAEGRFRFEGLAAGPYLLVGGQTRREVALAGAGAAETRLGEYYGGDPVRAEAPARDVEVHFCVGVPVEIEVVDASDRAVDDVDVVFWSPGDRPRYRDLWSGLTRGGVASLGLLDPGETGRLRLTPPPGRPDLAPLEVEEWTPAIRRFVLASVPTISGIVRDPRGQPVAGATIDLDPPSSPADGIGRSGPDGAFRVAAAAGDALRVRAYIGRPDNLEGVAEPDAQAISHGLERGEGALEAEFLGAVVVAEAGATDVRLTVEPGVGRVVRVRAPNAERYAGRWGTLHRISPSVSRWRQEVLPGGVIALEHLAPGAAYSLFVPGPDDLPPLWIERFEGVPGPLEIDPARTTPVDGRLLLANGEPAADMRVGLFGAGWWAYGSAHDDGTFRIAHAIGFPAELEVVPGGPRRVGDAAWRPVTVTHAGEPIELRAVPHGEAR